MSNSGPSYQIPDLVDPDPWVVINALVCVVAAVGQLVSVGIQIADRPHQSQSLSRNVTAREKLRDHVETAIRNTEKLIRLLQKSANGQGGSLAAALFGFGNSGALFQMDEFNRYKELVPQIALDVGGLSAWALTLIQTDEAAVVEIGQKIALNAGNVQQKMNHFYAGGVTNETVLDECLLMLRTFQKILDTLDGLKN